MKNTIISEYHDDFVILKCSGTRNNLKEMVDETNYINNFLANSGQLYAIVDFTEVILKIKFSDIFNVIRHYDRKIPDLKDRTVALIINTNTADLGNYWEELSSNKGYNFKVFEKIENAKEWIMDQKYPR